MSLLSYKELRLEVVQRNVMTNVPDANINGSSIDVRLGGTILVEHERPEELSYPVVELGARESLAFDEVRLQDRSEEGAEPFLLYPGQFILAQTLETFNLPLTLSAEFRLKSSVARMGLSHALAVWCDPGWHGSALTLELHNITQQHVLALYAGDKVGQMIFHRHAPVPAERSYAERGAYNQDRTSQAAKPAVTPPPPAPPPPPPPGRRKR